MSTIPEKPHVWLIDSNRKPLAESLALFDAWAETTYFGPGDGSGDWNDPPDAVFVSAELPGGAEGETFAALCETAGQIPLLIVARLRSLAQALAFFRAGAADYLSLPLDEGEIRERLAETLHRAERRALSAITVEIEPLAGESLPIDEPVAANSPIVLDVPNFPNPPGTAEKTGKTGDARPLPPPPSAKADAPEPKASAESVSAPAPDPDSEPIPVDGLPIPKLWDELPCGLLVFDSIGNLVFSNALGLELFGHQSLAELQDALEHRLASFDAHAANHKPLADNQWPQAQARKTRVARSAVVSVRKPDRRRAWLRIDCLPHLAEGKINRMCMTLVNLTGELPPLAPPDNEPAPPPARGRERKRGGKRR